MEFIETPTFTRLVAALLSDDEYRKLQNELLEDPERGALIRGGGGDSQAALRAAGTRQARRGASDLLLGERPPPDLSAGDLPQVAEG